MGFFRGPNTVRDGIVFHVDFANPRCYPGSGTDATDLINGTVGPAALAPTVDTNFKNNLLFDASTDQRFLFPNAETTDCDFTTGNYTIMFVARWVDGDNNGRIISRGYYQADGWSMFLDEFGAEFRMYDTTFAAGNWSFDTDEWAHYALIRTTTTDITLYKNNVSLGVRTGGKDIATTSQILSIGGRSNGGSTYLYGGNVGLVKIWNRDLSADELTQEYNVCKTRFNLE
jgi:hypothetical protein